MPRILVGIIVEYKYSVEALVAQYDHVRVAELGLVQSVVGQCLDSLCVAHIKDLLAHLDVLLESIAQVDVKNVVVFVFLVLIEAFDFLSHF